MAPLRPPASFQDHLTFPLSPDPPSLAHPPCPPQADFGLSKHKYNTFCSNVHDLRGTLPYMAPEMIMDHTHVTGAVPVAPDACCTACTAACQLRVSCLLFGVMSVLGQPAVRE
jgi:serine/threonine protein kinase